MVKQIWRRRSLYCMAMDMDMELDVDVDTTKLERKIDASAVYMKRTG